MDLQDNIYDLPEAVDFPIEHQKLLCVLKEDQFGEAETNTLKAICQAIKINFESDVSTLVLKNGQKVSLGSSAKKFDVILFFGVNPKDASINIDAKLYRIFKFEGPSVLVSHHLQDISADKNKKLYLWKCLQALFHF